MRTIPRTLALGALALGPLLLPVQSARAQDPSAEVVTRFTFEDELVRGDLMRPDGEVLPGRRRRPRTTLIRARSHFVPELYGSVEDL